MSRYKRRAKLGNGRKSRLDELRKGRARCQESKFIFYKMLQHRTMIRLVYLACPLYDRNASTCPASELRRSAMWRASWLRRPRAARQVPAKRSEERRVGKACERMVGD